MAGEIYTPIYGNITSDIILKQDRNGNPYVTFTIAHSDRIYDRQTGQYRDGDTTWLFCMISGAMARNFADSRYPKGTRVVAIGRMRPSRPVVDANGRNINGIMFEIEEIGPSNRFATVNVNRVKGSDGGVGGGYQSGPVGGYAPQQPQMNGADPYAQQQGQYQQTQQANAGVPAQDPFTQGNGPAY